jgi:hypothetical protein
MAAIMASIFLVTITLFAHALTTPHEQPAPSVARIASR